MTGSSSSAAASVPHDASQRVAAVSSPDLDPPLLIFPTKTDGVDHANAPSLMQSADGGCRFTLAPAGVACHCAMVGAGGRTVWTSPAVDTASDAATFLRFEPNRGALTHIVSATPSTPSSWNAAWHVGPTAADGSQAATAGGHYSCHVTNAGKIVIVKRDPQGAAVAFVHPAEPAAATTAVVADDTPPWMLDESPAKVEAGPASLDKLIDLAELNEQTFYLRVAHHALAAAVRDISEPLARIALGGATSAPDAEDLATQLRRACWTFLAALIPISHIGCRLDLAAVVRSEEQIAWASSAATPSSILQHGVGHLAKRFPVAHENHLATDSAEKSAEDQLQRFVERTWSVSRN